MSAVLMTPPYLQFFDDDGLPLAGGKVYTYTATGTFSTLKATYTDASGDTEADNPVILDASGRPTSGGGSIWLSGTYDFKVTDSLDNTIETTLDVTAFTTLPSASDAYFQSFSGNGSATAFTTSSDLGTDEKAIYVWVDAGAGKGYDIQNPSAYTINGTTLTFNSAPASGTNNIYVSAPSLLVGAASSAAADAAASAAAAAASEAQAGDYAGQLVITSSSSIAIGTGSKTFTVSSGLSLSNGQFIVITSDAAPTTNYMWGQISSYSSTTLQVTVSATGGSGTYTDWTMYLTGARGATGATGSISDFTGVSTATAATGDYLVFQDVSASDVTRKDTISNILALQSQSLSLLSTQTASASATLSFISVITSSYDEYLFVFKDILPSGSATIQFLASTNNGSTYAVNISTQKEGVQVGTNTAPTYSNTNNTTPATLTQADGSVQNGSLWLQNPLTTGSGGSGGGGFYSNTNCASGLFDAVHGTLNSPAVNAIRFQPSSGTFTSGKIYLYGVKNT